MSLIANNSYKFNFCMDFWGLCRYSAQDLMDKWTEICEYAGEEDSEENAFFLADCMDILKEKVRKLSASEGERVLNKAKDDIAGMNIGDIVLRMAG